MAASTPRKSLQRFLPPLFTSLIVVGIVMATAFLPESFTADWLLAFAFVFTCFLSVWIQFYTISPKPHWWRQVFIAIMLIGIQTFLLTWNFWPTMLISLTVFVPWFIFRRIRVRQRS